MASLTTRKRKPWIIETYVEAVGQWFELERFRYEDEAQAHLGLLQKRKHPNPLQIRRDEVK